MTDIENKIDLDIRDYFAAHAMKAVLLDEEIGRKTNGEGLYDCRTVAVLSYMMADEMILAKQAGQKIYDEDYDKQQ